MNNIKPLSSMTTPRYADIATFFRLPVVKDLKDLDYCICGVPWDGGTTNRPGARHGPREVRNASSLITSMIPYDQVPNVPGKLKHTGIYFFPKRRGVGRKPRRRTSPSAAHGFGVMVEDRNEEKKNVRSSLKSWIVSFRFEHG